MPTKDIKIDYLAVGDGQIATLTVSFSSVTNQTHLVVFSNTFNNATDAGKKIVVQDWTAVNGSNPAGAVLSTIVSVGAFAGGQQTLVLDTLAQQTVTSTSKLVEWGTDDTTAFLNFASANAGLSGVVLTIPAGRYCFARPGGGSRPVGENVKSLTINGSGSPVLSDFLGVGNGFFLGSVSNVLFNDNQAEALIQTVQAGVTVLPMVTVADATKYSANTWAWMTGFDEQGADGSPPNLYWHEFVFITSVDTVAGTVTIQTPLKNAYKSTWPKWVHGSVGSGAPTYDGGKFSQGGPATLYLLNQNWDAVHVYNNVGFRATPTVVNSVARDITFNNCPFESFGPNVSMQQNCTINNSTVPAQWELDKGVENFTLTNSTIRGFFGPQNSSPVNVVLDNVTIQSQMAGTTKNWTARNCTFPAGGAIGGPTATSVGESVNISNTSFAGQLVVGGVAEDDLTGVGGYSMANGIIMRSKVLGGTGSPPQWAVPGHYFVFGSRYKFESPPVLVRDIWDDGTTLYISTTLSGGFPSPVFPATTIKASTYPPSNFTFTNCTGCDDAVSLSAVGTGSPQFSKWKLNYPGNIGPSDPSHLVKIYGELVSVKVTVNAGYSAGTFSLDGPFVITKPGNVQVRWDPVFDLSVPGVRQINSDGTVSGTAGTDANLIPPNSGSIWFVDNQITPSMSGAAGAGSVTLEITADQGFKNFGVAPLQLRLHA